jgi:outer membrane lipoprotein SlyB
MAARILLISALFVAAALAGCVTTRFHERQCLADRATAFDQDRQVVYLRDKIEAAREGGFGGFGGAAAGGCGCE